MSNRTVLKLWKSHSGRCRTAECQISGIVTTERVTRQVSCLASHWGFCLRLLLFYFLAFTSDCIAALNEAFDRIHSASLLPLLFFLLVGLFRHRTRFLFFAFTSDCCSFAFSLFAFTSDCCSFAFSLSNAYGFSALSCCSSSLSLSPPTVALSLSRFQMHSASLHSLLALYLCRFTSDCCSFTFSLSLPTE
jgi:hypothetical protein